MKIRQRKLAQVHPYWRNPRDNAEAIPAVKESIERFGCQQPIVVDAQGTIIAGHTRYFALLELGWESAPVVEAQLSEADAKAYRIADNKTHEKASWDETALLAELRELSAEAMQVFFDTDLEAMLQQSVGETYTPPTPEAIGQEQDRHDSQMGERSEQRQDHIELLCPHCGEVYYVSRAEILRQ